MFNRNHCWYYIFQYNFLHHLQKYLYQVITINFLKLQIIIRIIIIKFSLFIVKKFLRMTSEDNKVKKNNKALFFRNDAGGSFLFFE